jgi:hypothetical protein
MGTVYHIPNWPRCSIPGCPNVSVWGFRSMFCFSHTNRDVPSVPNRAQAVSMSSGTAAAPIKFGKWSS